MSGNRPAWEDVDLPTLDRLIDDLRGHVRRPPAEDPRGLLPVPPLVEALVAREARRHAFTAEERQRLADNLTLQYFFEDRDVLFRRTPQGIEVLAAGMEEIDRALGELNPDERREWTYGQG
jgi:hypothetical protein